MTPHPYPTPPLAFNSLSTGVLHLSDALRLRLWRAIVTDPSMEAATLRYTASRVNTAPDRRLALASFLQTNTPHRLVAIVEYLTTHRRLSRREANEIMEGILRMTRPDGFWQ